ncbi:hypothetical protein ACI3L1_15725 [Deinococcus sp. SM5_A1]|uniref:hypothetical protein n=1 Tax=Deinococcus sp. SM5_A1 TaxID=3379094 RepID=UPI00385FFC1C
MLGGRLSSGGHRADSLHQIATRTKGDALFRGIEIIILTPSPRKGQAKAETHKSVLKLIHILPKVDDTTRFIRIPRRTNYQYGNAPQILPHQAAMMKTKTPSFPQQSIDVLLSPRRERIEQAQSDLEIDGVISSSQLRRYYGLEPVDLAGRLLTVALIRPVASRPALEVQQTLVVSGAEIARLNDTDLNHKLTLTETRLMLGIEADPEVWQVNPKPSLKLNQPDGVWISEGQRVAIEADTGQYHMRIVDQKLDSFAQQGYASTIWGTGSEGRAKNIEKKLGSRYKVSFVRPSWWAA